MKTKTDDTHKGHEIVKDAWSINFEGADPNTSYWCLTCREPVRLVVKPKAEKKTDEKAKSTR